MKAPQLHLHQPPPAVPPVLSGRVEDCLAGEGANFFRKEMDMLRICGRNSSVMLVYQTIYKPKAP